MKDGIIFLDKPAGLITRKVDNALGRLYQNKRVGHLGTLDPFASGLLIVGIGEGTKFLSTLKDSEKTYIAEAKLGIATSTADLEGEIISSEEVPELTFDRIKEVLKSFLGESLQTPPMFSAVRIDGKRLYESARKDIKIDVPPRKILIREIELLSYDKDKNVISFLARVSKGTYIRVLAEDIAKKLNTIAHLISLRRVCVDDFRIDAPYVSSFDNSNLVSIKDAAKVFGMELATINDFKSSNDYCLNCSTDFVLALDQNDVPLAIMERVEVGNTTKYHVKRGLNVNN